VNARNALDGRAEGEILCGSQAWDQRIISRCDFSALVRLLHVALRMRLRAEPLGRTATSMSLKPWATRHQAGGSGDGRLASLPAKGEMTWLDCYR
jgi:hypothetical protein